MGVGGPTPGSLGAPAPLAETAGYEMRSLGFNDEYAEEDLPRAVVHTDSDADVAALEAEGIVRSARLDAQ